MDQPAPILNTVIIETTRMAELADFYRRAFGLDEPSATGGDHVGFALPNVYLGFDLVAEQRAESPGTVSLWFEVKNLDETFQHLVSIGARVKYGPTIKPWGAELAAVHDPDNNIIGLAQSGSIPE